MSDEFEDVMARARARLAALDRAATELAEPVGRRRPDADSTRRDRRLLDDVIEELTGRAGLDEAHTGRKRE